MAGRSGLERFARVLIQNQTVNVVNKQLLVTVVSCIGALADGRGPAWVATTAHTLTAVGGSTTSMRSVMTNYLSQVQSQSHLYLDLIHACSACLCILCGHSTSG